MPTADEQATLMMLKRHNIRWNKETAQWEAWDESSTFLVCQSPYCDVALSASVWYADNILGK